jgi:autotransporter-associated beta strand protein
MKTSKTNRSSRIAVVHRAGWGVCSVAGGLLIGVAEARGNVTIIPAFDSTITGDPNAATIESTINTAISSIEADLANPVTVNITFGETTMGLGQSNTHGGAAAYTSYLFTLQNNQTLSPDDNTALATLPPGPNNPVNGNANIASTLPLFRALGFSGANPPPGQPDSTILFNSGLVNNSRPGSNPNNVDLQSVITHEVNEVLGIGGPGSQLNAVLNGTSSGAAGPLDLFRYSGSGARSFSTSTGVSSFFSIDGGNTNFEQFNQDGAEGDFADWGGVIPNQKSTNNPAQVQDAFAGPGITPAFEPNEGPNELAALDVVGWNLTPAALALEARLPTTLTWNDASANNLWDNSASSNWNNGSGATVFHSNDNITLSDNNGSASGRYSVTLNTSVFPGSITVNNSSASYTIGGTGSITGTGSLTKNGTGQLTLNTVNLYGGGTNVTAGTLVVGVNSALPDAAVNITGGTLQLAASTGLAQIASVAISGTGKFDVNNNHVIINYGGGSDPVSSIAALLASGFNMGAWNGPGIDTSAAAANPGYALGYADAADAGNPAGLSLGNIEIKFTLIGDADLNGTVNGIDFGILAANFNKTVSRWDQGDFDYNGIVNGIDFTGLASNFNKATSGASALSDPAVVAFAEANGLMADIPEPASFLSLMIGSVVMMRRRRANRREHPTCS